MTHDVTIKNVNSSHVHVSATNSGILREISDYFSFEAQNAQWDPRVRNGFWDGRIRFLCYKTRKFPKGILQHLINFLKERDYTVDVDYDCVSEPLEFDPDFISKEIKLAFEPYDFQTSTFEWCLENRRGVLLSAVNSGKSLIIYFLIRYFLQHFPREKILLVVPTIDLVTQLLEEFREYDKSYDIDSKTHLIFGGQSKDEGPNKKLVITTWQSVYKLDVEYFEKFFTVMVDEAHSCKAVGLRGILDKSVNAENRFGFTGTLDGVDYNELTIESLCGEIKDVVRTKQLIDRGISSEIEVKCIKFKYSSEVCKIVSNASKQDKKKLKKVNPYAVEQKFIVNYKKRTNKIAKIVSQIQSKDNVLILSAYVDHLEFLKVEIEKETNRKVIIVSGATKSEDRRAAVEYVNNNENCIILATYGVFSTGINCRNIQYLIMGTSSKSQVRVLQSFGRGLRLDNKTNKVVIIDIVDDLSIKSKQNYLLKHFLERIKIYTREEYPYSISKILI